MAVKVNNKANIRKAQRWDEKDDAALCVLLKRKLKDVAVALRESDSPYERSRLKEQRRHYKTMLRKVESGSYNGDIIFGELQAASALRTEQAMQRAEYSTMAGGRKYNSSYRNMDFDYESAFRKKRFYGPVLPILLLILSIAFVGIFIMGAFLPASIKDVAEDSGVPLDSLFMFKLGEDTLDISIKNDGNWPGGIYPTSTKVYNSREELEDAKKPATIALIKGEAYTDAAGNTPDTLLLYGDLGITAVYISPFDVVKAWFRTPMLEKTRIDFLEDSKYFQGSSFYYLCFLEGDKGDALIIQKDADGNFDNSVIIRHIGTYGTIMFLIIAFLLGVLNIIINLIRLFTYTSRRIHVITLLSLIFSALCMISPALATIEGTDIGAAFSAYFSSLSGTKAFMDNSSATAGIGLLFFVPAAINLVMLILPKLFRNRLKKRPTYVPKGNKNRSAYNDPLYADEEKLRQLV